MSDLEHLLTRDGELSELTLMRLEHGELDPEEAAFVEERLGTSLVDRRHADELRAFAAENPIAPPPELVEAEAPLERGWWKSWRGLGLAAVAAALVLIVLQPGRPGTAVATGEFAVEPEPATPKTAEDMRAKGREFDFRLQLEDEGRTRYGEPGNVVHPGERVQFVIFPRRAGHVLVVGVGPDGEPYPAHPREPGAAVAVQASATQVQLEGALAFDDALGPERFVAVWCPSTFDYDDAASVLRDSGASLPSFRDGCFVNAITLEKRERGAPDPDGPDAIDAFDPLGNVMEEEDEERPRPPDSAIDDPAALEDEVEDEEVEDDPDDGSADPNGEPAGVLPQ